MKPRENRPQTDQVRQPVHLTPFADLLSALHREGFLSINHKPVGGGFRSQIVAAADAVAAVSDLPVKADVWFGINDVAGPARSGERGEAPDVRRLVALYADLDLKANGLPTWEAIEAVVADLAAVLDTPPCAVIESGHGLQPIWAIDPADSAARWDTEGDPRFEAASQLLTDFGDVVRQVAAAHGGSADPVFDLARLLRVPGTTNWKFPEEPVPARLRPPTGTGPRSFAEFRQHVDTALSAASRSRPAKSAAKQPPPRRGCPPADAGTGDAPSLRYEQLLLRYQAQYVREATANSDRNKRLNNAALALGRQPGLEDDLITDVLIGAARETGLSRAEAAPTVASGLVAGRASTRRREGPASYAPAHGDPVWPRHLFRDLVFESALCIDHKMVLLALVHRMNKDSVCWPNRDTLSKMTGLNTKRISDCTQELTATWWLYKEKARWVTGAGVKPNAYWTPAITWQQRIPQHCTQRRRNADNLHPGPPDSGKHPHQGPRRESWINWGPF